MTENHEELITKAAKFIRSDIEEYYKHCVKSVQIRSNFWSVFSRIWTEYGYLSVFSPNAGKYGPEITPYLDTFQAVKIFSDQQYLWKERSNQAGIYLFRINNGNIKTMCDIALVT